MSVLIDVNSLASPDTRALIHCRPELLTDNSWILVSSRKQEEEKICKQTLSDGLIPLEEGYSKK